MLVYTLNIDQPRSTVKHDLAKHCQQIVQAWKWMIADIEHTCIRIRFDENACSGAI